MAKVEDADSSNTSLGVGQGPKLARRSSSASDRHNGLVPKIDLRCDEELRRWRGRQRLTDPIGRERVLTALKTIYRRQRLPAPQIFWCESPWQMQCMLSIIALLHADEKVWEDRLSLAQNASDPLWEKAWSQVLSQITAKRYSKMRLKGEPFCALPQKLTPIEVKTLYPDCEKILDRLEALFGARDRVTVCFKRWAEKTRCTAVEQISMNVKTTLSDSIDTLLQAVKEKAAFTLDRRGRWNSNINRTIYAVKDRLSLQKHLKGSWYGALASDWLILAEGLRVAREFWVARDEGWIQEWPVLAETGFAYLFCYGACFICDRPTRINFDDRGRLHNEQQAALTFADGYDLYSWHGITTSKRVIETPQLITTDEILHQENAEVRRLMIERFGGNLRFIVETRAARIAEDECGILYRDSMDADRPRTIVRVRNRTPEPDGTYKEYYLSVPPWVASAREAVAWTFGMSAQEYRPTVET